MNSRDITQWIRTQLKFALTFFGRQDTTLFYIIMRNIFTSRGLLSFYPCYAVNLQKMVPAAQVSFPWFSQNYLGGEGWTFRWTLVLFSLASFFSWTFVFICFRKLWWLLECLTCSLCTLILLSRTCPSLVWFTTVHTTCWVHQGLFNFAEGELVGHSFLNIAHLLNVYNITCFVDSCVCNQMSNSMYLRSGVHTAVPPLLFVLGIWENDCKMVVWPKDCLLWVGF